MYSALPRGGAISEIWRTVHMKKNDKTFRPPPPPPPNGIIAPLLYTLSALYTNIYKMMVMLMDRKPKGASILTLFKRLKLRTLCTS